METWSRGKIAVNALLQLLLRRFVFRMAEASAKRVTGDEPQGTMGRVQLSPSRLPLRARFKERRLGTREALLHVSITFKSASICHFYI